MAVKYGCDGCNEIYDSYKEAFECHLPLDYMPTHWEQMMIDDVRDEIDIEMDCA